MWCECVYVVCVPSARDVCLTRFGTSNNVGCFCAGRNAMNGLCVCVFNSRDSLLMFVARFAIYTNRTEYRIYS